MKIGILQEGFGLGNSEADVDKMVKEAAEQLGSKCGAVVEEVSIPMHSDGNTFFRWYFSVTFLTGFSVLGVGGRLLRNLDWSFLSIYILRQRASERHLDKVGLKKD